MMLVAQLAEVRSASAQSVDVQRSLAEDQAVQRPMLQIRPYGRGKSCSVRLTPLTA
jgi:hypothetical protein